MNAIRRSWVTIISELEFVVFDTDGNDITDQIQTPELVRALSEQLGPRFVINIDNDGNPEIEEAVSA